MFDDRSDDDSAAVAESAGAVMVHDWHGTIWRLLASESRNEETVFWIDIM